MFQTDYKISSTLLEMQDYRFVGSKKTSDKEKTILLEERTRKLLVMTTHTKENSISS